jgi:hypothetical protein
MKHERIYSESRHFPLPSTPDRSFLLDSRHRGLRPMSSRVRVIMRDGSELVYDDAVLDKAGEKITVYEFDAMGSSTRLLNQFDPGDLEAVYIG